MTSPSMTLEIQDRIAHLQFCRPAALNTLTPSFFAELSAHLQMLEREGAARVLILSSTGKHFCAGMALDVFTHGALPIEDQHARGRTQLNLLVRELQGVFNQIEALRMPVIAAIQGGCIGGGLDLVCAADVRLASAEAFFSIQEIHIGMIADLGTLQRLPKLIPEGVVHELAYSGRRLPATRALQLGLLNEVHADAAALADAAFTLAREIASKPPLALWGSKAAIHYARDHSTQDALAQMAWLQAACWDNAQLMESFLAKAEARPAQFPDLPPAASFLALATQSEI